MILAAELSARRGWIPAPEVAALRELLHSAGLPVAPPEDMTPEAFLTLMARDKKVVITSYSIHYTKLYDYYRGARSGATARTMNISRKLCIWIITSVSITSAIVITSYSIHYTKLYDYYRI